MTGRRGRGQGSARRLRTSPLFRKLGEFDVEAAQRAGLDRISDSALLAATDGSYDVLVTRDRSLSFQQAISGRRIAIIVLRTRDQPPAAFDALLPDLRAAIRAATPGTVTTLGERPS